MPDRDGEFLPGEELTILWQGGLPGWTLNLRLRDELTGAALAVVATDIPYDAGELRWTLPPVLCNAGYVLEVEEARRFGPEPLVSGLSEPFLVRCPDRVLLTKVVEVGDPLGSPVFRPGQLNEAVMDDGTVVFSSYAKSFGARIFTSPSCTTGNPEECASGPVLGSTALSRYLAADGGRFAGKNTSRYFLVQGEPRFDVLKGLGAAALLARNSVGGLTTVFDRFSPTPEGVKGWVEPISFSVDGERVALLVLHGADDGKQRNGIFLKDGERVVKLFTDYESPLGPDWVVDQMSRHALSSSSVVFRVRNRRTGRSAFYVATLVPGGGVLQYPPDCPDEPDLDGDGLGNACDPDADDDGIWNGVDGRLLDGVYIDESLTPSTSFSDQGRGGVSFGTMVSNTGVELGIRAGNQPLEGITAEARSGSGEAELHYCESPVTETRLSGGQWAGILCGSATVTAKGLPMQVVVGDVTIEVSNAVTAKVDQPTPEEPLEISNDIFSAAPVLATIGEVKLTMPSASGAKLSETQEGDLTIEPTPDSQEPITAEIKGQTIPIEPGAPPTRPVNIDIKPGSDENPINLSSKGSIPVAVLSSPTFDAATVDAYTATLASAPVKLKGRGRAQPSMEDVNGDGLLDQVVHISTQELSLGAGDD